MTLRGWERRQQEWIAAPFLPSLITLLFRKKQQPEPRPSFAVCLLWDPMNIQFLEITNHAIHQNIYMLACKISALSSLVTSNSLVLLFLSQLEMSALLQRETCLVGNLYSFNQGILFSNNPHSTLLWLELEVFGSTRKCFSTGIRIKEFQY